MPTRFIKESCRSSKNLDRVSDFEERIFWRLVTTADDFGRFQACPQLVRSACFPYRQISIPRVSEALLQLQKHALITIYEVGDRKYGEFVTWEKHQGKPRASKSKYPNRLDTSLQADASNCMQPLTNVTGHPDTDTNTDLNPNPEEEGNGEKLEKGDFEQFWECYPWKVGKKAARLSWDRAKDKPTLKEMLHAVETAKKTPRWNEDGGRYIPMPATWLNQGRWADVHVVAVPQLPLIKTMNGTMPTPKAFQAVTPNQPEGVECPPEIAEKFSKLLGMKGMA